MRRNTTTLLVIIAVLLALNLAVSLSRRAEAQPRVQVPARLVGITSPLGVDSVLRAWSDGVVEWRPVVIVGIGVPLWVVGSEWDVVQEQQP